MLNPFQRLLYCSRQGQKHMSTILVATGPYIHTFHASDGTHLSNWSPLLSSGGFTSEGKIGDPHGHEVAGEPPGKKRKLSPSREISASQSSVSQKGRNHTPKSFKVPSVSHLCPTNDGKIIVAVTGEDKCIRVLALSEDGSLEQLSERFMPKRPNALILTPDQTTILCGDKFGDVYALPLLENTNRSKPLAKAKAPEEATSTPFVPSANIKTVHTKRNLEVLKHQQKAMSNKPPKPEIYFEHHVLLGHVSLLTDLAYVTLKSESVTKAYILSSDRDEHIRISRGIPQTHVIEGYCLGHSQFVSKMCILPWKPEILVSGGGDDYLLVWDWLTGKQRQEVDLRAHYNAVKKTLGVETEPDDEVGEREMVVSGIWALLTHEQEGQIVIACEGLPALITFSVDAEGSIKYQQTITTIHNVLDVTVSQEDRLIIYSLDNVHHPVSTRKISTSRDGEFFGCQRFSAESNRWEDECSKPIWTAVNTWAKAQDDVGQSNDLGQLSDVFYGWGTLRKRGAEDPE